jgi:hypothetical protein
MATNYLVKKLREYWETQYSDIDIALHFGTISKVGKFIVLTYKNNRYKITITKLGERDVVKEQRVKNERAKLTEKNFKYS